MEMFCKELLIGGSSAALVAAMSFFAVPAIAQQNAASTAPVEQVTVTGTSIRGTAPVGSNVITVDQERSAHPAPRAWKSCSTPSRH